MSCAFSKEALALYVEGDLEQPAAAAAHLARCGACRQYAEELVERLALVKTLGRENAGRDECARMRRSVMVAIDDGRARIGWRLAVERAIVQTARRHAYALAATVLLALASVAALGQIRDAAPDARRTTAVFEDGRTLLRPSGYESWVALRRSAGPHASGVAYVSPGAYRQNTVDGAYPEGTVLIWQSSDTPGLLAAVRDSARFAGGWGFFDFTARDGSVPAKAEPLPDSSGCQACHLHST